MRGDFVRRVSVPGTVTQAIDLGYADEAQSRAWRQESRACRRRSGESKEGPARRR